MTHDSDLAARRDSESAPVRGGPVTLDPRHDWLALTHARARTTPERVAYVDYDVHAARASSQGTPLAPVLVTDEQFWDETVALAVALRKHGIRPGDTVAVQLPNRHEFALFFLALYAIGAVAMPVSPIYRSRDLSTMLSISSAVGLVVSASFGSFDYLAMASDLARHLPSLRVLISVGKGADRSPLEGILQLEDLLAEGVEHSSEREMIATGSLVPPPGLPVMLNFTSGTTGEPKGVLHSRETICAGVLATTERLELAAADTVFVAATLGHAGGFLNGIFMPLLLGARLTFMNVWDPGIALRIIEEERVTYGAMMPPYLVDITRHEAFATTDLSSWRTARVSGGVIPRGVMDALHLRLPQLRLCPGWGMSESLYVTCAGPGDPVEQRNSTDGRVVANCEVEIRDPYDDEQTLSLGEVGEIVIKTPSLMLGYFNRPDLTAGMFTPDGWFKTGDLGTLDENGCLTVRGRLKEIVLRGGENVPIVEVEMLLMTHEKVKSVSVVGVPDERLGERVCAVFVGEPTLPALDLDEMAAYLREKGLTPQFIPEYLVACAEMPVTAHGKIRKSDVKQIALDALGLSATSE